MMVSFLKNYWSYLVMIACGSYLTIHNVLLAKTWLGLIWLTFTLVSGVRFYKQYQQDKNHR
ncbi:hypothetical protein [Streptococcus caledonicus]